LKHIYEHAKVKTGEMNTYTFLQLFKSGMMIGSLQVLRES